MDIRSDKLDYLKKSQANFFQNYIKSKHLLIMTNITMDIKFGFGVDLLNLMASAVRGDTQCPFDLDPMMYLSFDSNKRGQKGEKHGTHCAVC